MKYVKHLYFVLSLMVYSKINRRRRARRYIKRKYKRRGPRKIAFKKSLKRYIKKVASGEMKWTYAYGFGKNAGEPGTYFKFSTNTAALLPTTGATKNNRIGNKIFVKSVYLTYTIFPTNYAPTTTHTTPPFFREVHGKAKVNRHPVHTTGNTALGGDGSILLTYPSAVGDFSDF